jgi:hypothetical protein
LFVIADFQLPRAAFIGLACVPLLSNDQVMLLRFWQHPDGEMQLHLNKQLVLMFMPRGHRAVLLKRR